MKKFVPIIIILILLAAGAGYYFSHNSKNEQKNWYSEFTLENGLRVVVVPNHKIPAVAQVIWYKVGSIDEVRGKSGLAHFLEHLMFKGTKKFPDGVFSKAVEANGGKQNAMTSADYTAYYQIVAKETLPQIMELEADRMRNLELTPAQVASENKVIIEERHMRYDNSPRMLLQEQIAAALYQNHPYGTQTIGWENEMAGLTREDALEFYKKYYAPNNATLIIAGDVEEKEVRKLAEKYYGGLEKSDLPPRASLKLKEPPQVAERKINYEDARVKQPELWRSYYAPSAMYFETKHAMPLVVLSKIMGEGTLSRLYQKLVVEQKIAIMAGTNYGMLNIGPTDFTIYAMPAKGVSVEQLEAAVDKEVQNILATGITEEELARAKKSMLAELVYQREGLEGMSFFAGQVIAVGLNPDFVTNLDKNLNAVTAAQVKEAAALVLAKNNLVTGYLKGK